MSRQGRVDCPVDLKKLCNNVLYHAKNLSKSYKIIFTSNYLRKMSRFLCLFLRIAICAVVSQSHRYCIAVAVHTHMTKSKMCNSAKVVNRKELQ